MTGHPFGKAPQDEWHRRVLALDDGLLPRHRRGRLHEGQTALSAPLRSQKRRFRMARYAALMVAIGVTIAAFLAMFW